MDGDEAETIYKIVQKEIPPPVKPRKYKSTHDPNRAPSASTFQLQHTSKPGVQNISGDDALNSVGVHKYKMDHATWGLPLGSYNPDPANFGIDEAQKKQKVLSVAEIKNCNPELLKPSQLKTKNRPRVPTKEDKPVMGLVSDKNYIVANAVEVILAAPKNVGADEKDWLKKASYGAVPPYLHRIKKDISDEYEYIQKIHEEEEAAYANQIQQMPPEKREELIEGLKAKWEQVNRDYQATTHLTKLDTLNKVKRKEHNEALLMQLEKHIQKLTKSSIFVDTTK